MPSTTPLFSWFSFLFTHTMKYYYSLRRFIFSPLLLSGFIFLYLSAVLVSPFLFVKYLSVFSSLQILLLFFVFLPCLLRQVKYFSSSRRFTISYFYCLFSFILYLSACFASRLLLVGFLSFCCLSTVFPYSSSSVPWFFFLFSRTVKYFSLFFLAIYRFRRCFV